MFGLPKSTEISKFLPKKTIFDRFKPAVAERRLFNEQISRLTIVAEISPQTVNIPAGKDVPAIYIILITLKKAECDKKNIALLSKLIDQRMLFALQHKGAVRFAVYRAGRALISEYKKADGWKLDLTGFDLDKVWENLIAETSGVDLVKGRNLDEAIAAKELGERLTKKIVALEKRAMKERQPRRKWELVEEIKRLKAELGGVLGDKEKITQA